MNKQLTAFDRWGPVVASVSATDSTHGIRGGSRMELGVWVWNI